MWVVANILPDDSMGSDGPYFIISKVKIQETFSGFPTSISDIGQFHQLIANTWFGMSDASGK